MCTHVHSAPDTRPGRPRVSSGSAAFNYVKRPGFNSENFCIFASSLRIVSLATFQNLSQQPRSSEAPVSWNWSTGSTEESLLIHSGYGGQGDLSQGIKATFVKIYREPCAGDDISTTRRKNSCANDGKFGCSFVVSSSQWKAVLTQMSWLLTYFIFITFLFFPFFFFVFTKIALIIVSTQPHVPWMVLQDTSFMCIFLDQVQEWCTFSC